MTKCLRLVTHGGSFHCDEVLAYAILCRALLPEALAASTLMRTRDQGVIEAADIVWDVGGVFDPTRGRFDHHQRGAPVRPDGSPYSSAGLLWAAFGHDAVRAILAGRGDENVVGKIWTEMDEQVIRLVDLADNGKRPVPDFGDEGLDRAARIADGMALSSLVEVLNLPWDADVIDRALAEDERFARAAEIAGAFLDGRVEQIRARIAARDIVLEAHARSADPRVLELDRGMPWQGPAHDADLPVLFAVYPDKGGDAWMVGCMPPEPGSFAQKLPLPAAWAGLRDAELARVSKVSDAVFCHLNRFIAAARSREGALAMARIALGLAREPAGLGAK
ncbi:MYG1 family protein (plasmid) [Azospirillum oryzae]|uniref:MYG1 family protein n=1 Tax=Azospirillum oryzae TaxID=286727 RepID=A0A6N1AEF1_9PROT|nr:MYG1 family protein [Azospirillum oryzae]KAA0588763.1 MYG1 family protein [Azospirillum oryzae]QKS50111.1 MYG1 family protein [Azospirillum oryzae]GLR81378.1 metal-dependent hydrolase [Azospirillum oryzae]